MEVWLEFSDIKDGTHTFECGAKLTMVSDTESVVSDLPTTLPQTPNRKYCCRLMLDMTPSYTFKSEDLQIVETNVFEEDKKFLSSDIVRLRL